MRIGVILALVAGCGGPGGITEALDGTCPGRPPQPTDEGPLRRVTLDAPGAVCNDGTPAGMYVRRALDPAHEADWVLWLEGGGFCSGWEECTKRWCTSRNLMSSFHEDGGKPDGGLFEDAERNRFRGWNHVELQYCTSDLWLGRSEQVVLSGQPSYDLSFQGHHVVQGALAALEAGAVSDDGTQRLPSLLDARRIVFGGSSAGAHGAAHHLDLVAETYPDAEVLGVFDSLLFPKPSALTRDVREGVEEQLRELWQEAYVGLYDAWTDGGCDEGYRCVEMWHVQRYEIATPALVRHDLYDPVGGRPYFQAGATERQYASGALASFEELQLERPHNALLGPACGDHIAARDAAFFEQTVGGRSFHDALEVFVEDDKPARVFDDLEGTLSSCP